MSVNDATWAEIRRLYISSKEPVAEIARRHKVSDGQIYARAKKQGWPKRSQRRTSVKTSRPAKSSPEKAADGSSPHPTQAAQEAVVRRLYRAIDAKLKRLEIRMTAGDELSAADSERETRELGTMIRSFEKVTEFAADLDKVRQSSAPNKKRISAADAERMREEIAQRLERIHGQQGDAADAGQSERR